MLGHRIARLATTLALAAGSVGLGAAVLAGPASAAPSSGTVYVLHGIAGTKLQFFIDDRSIGGVMATKSIIGPVSLPDRTR